MLDTLRRAIDAHRAGREDGRHAETLGIATFLVAIDHRNQCNLRLHLCFPFSKNIHSQRVCAVVGCGHGDAHLADNEDSWRRSWDDLRDDYVACVKQFNGPWSFDELRSRVVVDWNADVKGLKRSINEGKNFRVIWLSDGSSCSFQDREANQIVRCYLLRGKSDTIQVR